MIKIPRNIIYDLLQPDKNNTDNSARATYKVDAFGGEQVIKIKISDVEVSTYYEPDNGYNPDPIFIYLSKVDFITLLLDKHIEVQGEIITI